VARFDFAILWDLGPVLAQNLQAILIDLYLPATLPASAFEAEIKTADKCPRTKNRKLVYGRALASPPLRMFSIMPSRLA
jgi:hypothetical protein